MYKISTENIGNAKKYLWHYRRNNKEYGPFTYEDIIELVRKGEIGPEDYVLKFGNKKFIKASEIKGLFDITVQPWEKKEEQMEEKPEEQTAESKEDIKEEMHVSLENTANDMQEKHRPEASGQRIAMIIAGAAGICLLIWILKLLL